MRVLVTGAGGLVGRQLQKELADLDQRVFASPRLQSGSVKKTSERSSGLVTESVYDFSVSDENQGVGTEPVSGGPNLGPPQGMGWQPVETSSVGRSETGTLKRGTHKRTNR